MRKINILTKNIYNRIAAGEVIDRPYSAVKELIENSIDAGATQIDVYIERGGKQLIKIVDNGCGIERDDMRAAFLPHATSKISSVDDLENIATLGFRGEALASISVISKVTLTSVTEGNSAYCVKCEDGLIGQVEEAAIEKGTEICVRDLFYNTPVRAKFLKADKKEEADITSFVTRYILCKPEISFRYFVDGKLALQSHGGGLDEAVAQVYGAKVITQCFKIDAEKDGIKINGYIGNQNFFKPNKTYQSLFLNGRYIVNN
ncbi:MAG: DNA mismatch repair endonuclease MutL, partial [Clostridia bacterium]|nr:DNA mismatch repair endonuclease MutL [Clostridia bacterium]